MTDIQAMAQCGPREPVPCPYCHSKTNTYFSAQDVNRQITNELFIYNRCTNCGLIFMDAIPEDIASYYRGGYQAVPTSLEEFRALSKKDKYRLEPILRYKRGGKLLEIGPWTGVFASNAKDAGFDVTVIEMNSDCVHFIEGVLEIKAIQSSDPVIAMEHLDEQFDVVALWHSLEHLPKPWSVIQEIARILKPGGILLVAIPNIESHEFRVLKSRWLHIDAPRHVCFYPLDSLTALCKENGLYRVETTTSDRLSWILRRDSWRSWANIWGRKLVRWPVAGRVLGAVLGRLAGWSARLLVGPAGQREGAGAGITAIYVKQNSAPFSLKL